MKLSHLDLAHAPRLVRALSGALTAFLFLTCGQMAFAQSSACYLWQASWLAVNQQAGLSGDLNSICAAYAASTITAEYHSGITYTLTPISQTGVAAVGSDIYPTSPSDPNYTCTLTATFNASDLSATDYLYNLATNGGANPVVVFNDGPGYVSTIASAASGCFNWQVGDWSTCTGGNGNWQYTPWTPPVGSACTTSLTQTRSGE